MSQVSVTILGCGASGGVPIHAGGWGACDPKNPKNRRRRCAIVVAHETTRILIDSPPDLRQQLIDADISDLSAVIFTHGHADHLHGIDDLRGINRAMRRELDAYATEDTFSTVMDRFGYAFEPADAERRFWRPVLRPHPVSADGAFSIGSLAVRFFEQDHGYSTTTGVRIGPIVYSTDVKRLSDAAFEVISGASSWIVDCQHFKPQPTHSHFHQTLAWIKRAGVPHAVLTHMGNAMDYDATLAQCPPGVEPAYDGMHFSVDFPALLTRAD